MKLEQSPTDVGTRRRPSWSGRLFGVAGRRRADPAHSGPAPGSGDGLRAIADRLIAEDRGMFLLLAEAAGQVADRDATRAWESVRKQMALIPAGTVPVVLCDGTSADIEVAAFLLDRFAVTNRQFLRFVEAGGYDALDIWPQEVWPSVSRFTDRTGRPGPRGWEGGKFPAGLADHPVVGVCWYEALAFARWVGKRLPLAAEWQKAGGWPEQLSGGECSRYPWGDLFDPARANLRASGIGRTVPVTAFPRGATANGIYQMSGNVWEWLDDPLEAIPCEPGQRFVPWKRMRRIAGGAFDTHFPGEATCQFVSGQGELDRRHNIGFRCAMPVEHLRPFA